MNLRTAEAYWLMKNGLMHIYRDMPGDLKTEVAVIGAGISGALAAHYLSEAGFEVAVLDKRHPGMGSTAASTALLQYEIDEPLHTLKKIVGPKRAERSYLACVEALEKLGRLVRERKMNVEFQEVPSLQYASYKTHVPPLKEEYEARKSIGLEVEWLEAPEIEKRFFLKAPGGLWSAKAGKVDAYALAHALLSSGRSNLRVFDNVEVKRVEAGPKTVTLTTAQGPKVTAKYLIIACGYESEKFLPFSVVTMETTYAFVTKPLKRSLVWDQDALLWETKTPYLYMRTTENNRLLVGGRDDGHHDPRKRDRALTRKIKALAGDVEKLLGLEVKPDFGWAGAFGSTKDALGYIGEIRQLPRTYFIMGFGGNGILYSQIGAEVVLDSIQGRKNEWKQVFGFNR